MGRRSPYSPLRRTARTAKLIVFFNLAAVCALGGWYLFQPDSRQEEVSRLVGNAFEREKRVSPLEVVWDLWQLYYAENASVLATALGDPVFCIGGIPRAKEFSHGTIRVLTNRGYLVGYCDALQAPVWAAYRIRDLPRIPVAPQRPDRFEVDRRTMAKVSPEAYTNSSYDRGHLAPNYAIATRFGEQAQRETFLMSNVVPQKHALNAGLWKDLESRIATNYPARYEEVWVLCGPVFAARPERLGKGVAIPDLFFAIVVDAVEGRLRSMAFLIPQEIPRKARLSSFLVSIDAVESATGLDFMAELEDETEKRFENSKSERAW